MVILKFIYLIIGNGTVKKLFQMKLFSGTNLNIQIMKFSYSYKSESIFQKIMLLEVFTITILLKTGVFTFRSASDIYLTHLIYAEQFKNSRHLNNTSSYNHHVFPMGHDSTFIESNGSMNHILLYTMNK
ncbi:unnamed protein product [Heterobilharzia americana]|nr:unnamed protein product [Heterobilharzia americana]